MERLIEKIQEIQKENQWFTTVILYAQNITIFVDTLSAIRLQSLTIPRAIKELLDEGTNEICRRRKDQSFEELMMLMEMTIVNSKPKGKEIWLTSNLSIVRPSLFKFGGKLLQIIASDKGLRAKLNFDQLKPYFVDFSYIDYYMIHMRPPYSLQLPLKYQEEIKEFGLVEQLLRRNSI